MNLMGTENYNVYRVTVEILKKDRTVDVIVSLSAKNEKIAHQRAKNAALEVYHLEEDDVIRVRHSIITQRTTNPDHFVVL